MGLLNRLFGGKKKKEEAGQPSSEPAADCIHGTLVPRWDRAEDIGKNQLVTAYRCESCFATFSREEGERIQAEAAARLLADKELRTGAA